MKPSLKNLPSDLSRRDQDLMRFTVQEYISTAKPVGSKVLAQKYAPHISPATIRKVLAHLEELGLLKQPHLSAGRIPTPAGFRYFTDYLLQTQDPSSQQKENLNDLLGETTQPSDSLRRTSEFLAHCSRQIGLVTSPRLETTIFKQIQFVRIDSDKILAIFIAQSGMIEQRVVQWHPSPQQEDLWKMARYLNDLLSDLTLREVRQRISEEMQKEQNRYDDLIQKALQLRKIFLHQNEDLEVFIAGHSQLPQQPEFMKQDKIRLAYQALEQKHTLLKILERADHSPKDSAQIILGDELGQKEFSGLAFVTRGYGPLDKDSGQKTLGGLAIAGPTRMDYCRIVPIVNFTADTINELFTQSEPSSQEKPSSHER